MGCIPNRVMPMFDFQVFRNILKHRVIPCTAEDLSTLQDRCRDPAVSVRKQALQSITELLVVRKKKNEFLCRPQMSELWVKRRRKQTNLVHFSCSFSEFHFMTVLFFFFITF